MNAVLKSKKVSDFIVSPNRYAILSGSSSTDHVTPPISANIYRFPRKPDSSKLAPWAKEHAQMHWSFCRRDQCYWHHEGDMFDKKEYEDQTKRPQEPAEKGVLPKPGRNTISAKEGKTLKPEPKNSKQGRTRPDISWKTNEPERQHNLQRRNSGCRAPPSSAMWVAQRLAEEKPERMKGILSLWVNPARQAEVTEKMIDEINQLSDQEAVEALEELQHGKQYIRRTGGQQMDVPVQLQMVDDRWLFATKALLDSGCTGLAMNKKFVEKHSISTKKVARPIPIYNADGTRNEAGSIREYVEIRMVIQDHVERIQLAVTNTRNSDLFMGLEWL